MRVRRVTSGAHGEGCRAEAQRAQAGENLTTGHTASHMNGFSYVYILESLSEVGGYYVGLTDDIANRLVKLNEGGITHTARLRPWRVKTAIAFRDRDKAAAFEKYLKSPSERAFGKKRL
jgi:predicted GIY-YIG superfamily endonuclease